MKILINNIKDKSKNTFDCLVEIPLSFVEGVSPTVLKYLAKNCQITTIEELDTITENELCSHIRNKKVLIEVTELRKKIVINKKVNSERVSLFNKNPKANVKHSPKAEQKLIGLFLFSNFLKPQYRGEKSIKFKLLEIIIPDVYIPDENNQRSIQKVSKINSKEKKQKRNQKNALRALKVP